jgi:hypothetical protein
MLMKTTPAPLPPSPVSALRAAWLLTWLQLRRQLNQLRSAYRFRKSSAARTGTARKRSSGGLLTAFVVISMIGNVANMSHQAVVNIHKALGTTEVYNDKPRSYMGVQIATVTAELGARLNITPPRGALIAGLAEGGPAEPAGIRAGDVIMRFDGKDVGGPDHLRRLILATPVGKSAAVIVIRDGMEQRRMVTLAPLPEDTKPVLRPLPAAPGSLLAPGVLQAATLAATLLFMAALFVALANREFARPEWDLEWLVTLPVPLSTLLWSRLAERAVTNTPGLVLIAPFLSMIAWECGFRWSAPAIGVALAFSLLCLASVLHTLVDTGLRVSLSPPKLRNLQAIVSVISVLPLFLTMAVAMHETSFIFGWATEMPQWTAFLPSGLAVRALASADSASAAGYAVLMLGEIGAAAAIGSVLLRRQLRHGIVAAGVREAALRRPQKARAATTEDGQRVGFLSVVQRRELRLLARDRTFMAQTLVMPAVMVGLQVALNATNIVQSAIEHPENLAAIAFALAAYTLMLSAFQTLNAEGQALWILYSVPQPAAAKRILCPAGMSWARAAKAIRSFVMPLSLRQGLIRPCGNSPVRATARRLSLC